MYSPTGFNIAYKTNVVDIAKAHLWHSKYLDPTNLIWMGERYYDPQNGRFISTDPVNAAIIIGKILKAESKIIDRKITRAVIALSLRIYSSVSSLVTIRSLDFIILDIDSLSHCSNRVSPSSNSISARRSRSIFPRRCIASTMQPNRLI